MIRYRGFLKKPHNFHRSVINCVGLERYREQNHMQPSARIGGTLRMTHAAWWGVLPDAKDVGQFGNLSAPVKCALQPFRILSRMFHRGTRVLFRTYIRA